MVQDVSVRASIRRIEKIEAKRTAKGYAVLNLTGADYRLRDLQGAAEAIPRCYASVLGNCSGGISKEHYVSDNILDQLDSLDITSLPWLKGAKGTIAPRDILNSKCLCEYHNSFLAPLDALAGAMFDNFARLMDPAAPEVYVWGPSFERWLLKVLLGMAASKHIYSNGERVDFSTLPNEWIEVLFGTRDFAAGTGLFQTPTVGAKITPEKRIKLETLMLDGDLRGLRFTLAGIEYYLSMIVKERGFKRDHPAYEDILHKPNGLNLDARLGRIQFFWQ